MVDTANIQVQAGNGGDGFVSFLRLKFMPKGGPDGGNGGDGGSIYLVGNPHMNTLRMFSGKQKFEAVSGEIGGKRQRSGAGADDLLIDVPVGTVVWEMQGEEKVMFAEVIKDGQKVLVARGGYGGKGNMHFKSSTNTTPLEFQHGTPGELRTLFLELKLLADIGLVGLPNAGKSTLLSVLTKATPVIGSYPFTTLEPNLGVMSGSFGSYVVADIPGLIEGASKGKGLGIEFLRHVERCKVLVYILSIDEATLGDESKNDAAKAKTLRVQYTQLQHELELYNPALLKKSSLIGISKIDLYDEKLRTACVHVFEKEKPILFSSATHNGIEVLRTTIAQALSLH